MKLINIHYPADPGLHENREEILMYLVFTGYAHLAAFPDGAGVTRITVFLVVDRWHMLIRSMTYTGMRVFTPDVPMEVAVDRAHTVSTEIPHCEMQVANPEYRPIES